MFPSLPTDNLYKFIFVACVFLIGIVVYNRTKKEEIISESYDKQLIEKIRNETHLDILDIDLKRFGRELNYWDSVGNELKKDSLRVILDHYISDSKKLKEDVNIFKENFKNISNKKIVFEKTKLYWTLVIVILILFSFISGFAWYHKVQKFQDDILKNEAILKENQAKDIGDNNKT